MHCKYIDVNNEWICSNCGTKVPKISDRMPLSFCRMSLSKFSQVQQQNEKQNNKTHMGNNREKLLYNGKPGYELKKLLSYIGIKSSPTCSCNQRARIMDEWGPDLCEKNIDTIVAWLEEESKNRKLPFIETVARLLIRKAIKNSRKKQAKT